jgi:hypothetical protein
MRNTDRSSEFLRGAAPARPAGRVAACLACGAMMLAAAAFAPRAAAAGAAPAPRGGEAIPERERAAMGILQRLRAGNGWNAELEGVRTHAGGVELRYNLSASKVLLHRTRPEIVGIQSGGRFRLREEGGGRLREIEAVQGAAGVRLVYRVNSEEAPVTPAVRAWLEDYLDRFRPRPSRR